MKTATKIVLLALAVAAVLAWPVYSLATSSGEGAGQGQDTQTDQGAANDNHGDNTSVQDASGNADDGVRLSGTRSTTPCVTAAARSASPLGRRAG